jgi:phage baseplate assembly protein W
MSFQSNPLNDDLVALKNETAIARSIRNIVFTNPGEKFFQPNFGSRISESLFENIDDISALTIQDEIEDSIRKYEPRVSLIDVTVNPNFDSNQFDVVIAYRVIGSEVQAQQLEFVLQPTR